MNQYFQPSTGIMQESIAVMIPQQHYTQLVDMLQRLTQDVQELKKIHQKPFYSVSEAAQKLGVSKAHIRNLYNAGKLAGEQEQTGGKIYIRPEAVMNFMEKHGR